MGPFILNLVWIEAITDQLIVYETIAQGVTRRPLLRLTETGLGIARCVIGVLREMETKLITENRKTVSVSRKNYLMMIIIYWNLFRIILT